MENDIQKDESCGAQEVVTGESGDCIFFSDDKLFVTFRKVAGIIR